MMPNHFHAVVRIVRVPIEGVHDPVPDVGTHGRARQHILRNHQKNKLFQDIAAIINKPLSKNYDGTFNFKQTPLC